jgi:hypothetical protein
VELGGGEVFQSGPVELDIVHGVELYLLVKPTTIHQYSAQPLQMARL